MRLTKHLALLLAVSLAAPNALAEESAGDQKNVLLINPGALLNGVISLEYERALNTFFGITVGASVGMFRGVFVGPTGSSYVGAGPDLGVRFHFIKDAPGGLWVGPALNLFFVAGRSGGSSSRVFGYGVSLGAGYNFIFGRHFVFQLGIGGGFADYGDGLLWSPHLLLGLGAAF